MRTRLVGLMLLALLCTQPGCRSTGPQDSPPGPRDNLIGWYKITGRDTVIPVLKAEGAYYSVCRGLEVPFRECPAGLEWALAPSSMKGTTLGLDETSKAYYIIIDDEQLRSNYDLYVSGEKTPMTRIEKPSGLLDPTALPPHTNDDFVGWYVPIWFPAVRWEIQRDGERYLSTYQELREPPLWETVGEAGELAPLPGGLGLTGFDRKNRLSLVYNVALKRFELTARTSPVIRMPLARIAPPPSPEGGEVPLRPMEIGIPSWH